PGNTNSPAALVADLRSVLVASPVSVTAALGITASDASRTLPRTTLVLAWGHAGRTASREMERIRPKSFKVTLLCGTQFEIDGWVEIGGSLFQKQKHCKHFRGTCPRGSARPQLISTNFAHTGADNGMFSPDLDNLPVCGSIRSGTIAFDRC